MNTNITMHSKEAHQAIENLVAHVFIRKDEKDAVLQGVDRLGILKERIIEEIKTMEFNYEKSLFEQGDPESLNNRNAQDVVEATKSANVGEDEKTS